MTAILFAVFVLALGAYTLLPIRVHRLVSAALAGLYVLAVIAGLMLFCGSPRSYMQWDMALHGEPRVKIISFLLVENEAIYLWMQVPWKSSPVYYSIPWDVKSAQGLIDAEGEAGGEGGGIELRPGAGFSPDGTLMPWARPVDQLPPKEP